MNLNNLINTLGWTIINSLWQGIFILLILAIALLIINPKHAKIRSMLAYASLLLVFAASIRTYVDLSIDDNLRNVRAENVHYVPTSNFVLFNNVNNLIEQETNNKSSLVEIIEAISALGNKNINYIVLFWFVGILLLTFKMLCGYYYMQKIKTKSIFEVEYKWQKVVRTISNNLQLSKTVKLFESAIVKFPTVIGYFKPVILMPLGSLAEMPMAQVEMILAHELAHVKRVDYLLNLIQSILEILYFFNPAVWLITKIIRNEREFACDDLAISLNNEGSTLANALLTIHQKDINRPAIAISALGTKNSLLRRIKRMVQKNNHKTDYPKKLALSTILLGGLFTLTIIACSTTQDNYNDRYETSTSLTLNSTPSISENDKIVKAEIPFGVMDEVQETKNISKTDDAKNKRKFNFHKDDIHWKGTVENGKVVTLYKDGDKISQSNINNYEDYILETLGEIDEDMAQLEIDMYGFKEDMANLKKDLSEMKIDLKNRHFDEIEEHFDSEEFRKEMSILRESLNEMKFDFGGEWKDELKSELDKLDDMDFDFDKESFKESMREFKENMKDFKIDMSDLDINLSNLRVDLKDLKVEMKMLKSFLNELRTDLVKEGYIESEDEDFDMELNKNEITVNDKKLPDILHNRYLKMYKVHFGKELENDFTIHN